MITSIDKLQQLINTCQCEVSLTVNAYRNRYKTIEEGLQVIRDREEASWTYLAPDVLDRVRNRLEQDIARMRAAQTIIELVFYPQTPVGSYAIYDGTIEGALDQALACLEDEE